MRLKHLQLQLLRLAALEEKAEPFVSCYLNSVPALAAPLEEKLRALLAEIPESARLSVEEASEQVRAFIAADISAKDAGVAAFARAGSDPFFLGLRLKAPLPNLVTASRRPYLYPLVEIRDNYDHYVVLHVTDSRWKILEVDLGAPGEELVQSRPGLRHREGREWTRLHLQNHRRERIRQLIKGGVRTLSSRMSKGWYKHFILTGEPRAMSEVRRCLTRSLDSMLVATVPYSGDDSAAALTALTLPVFRDYEEQESRRLVEQLLQQLATQGQGVAGGVASLAAVRRKQAHAVVMAKDFKPGPAWACPNCEGMAAPEAVQNRCPGCGDALRPIDLKEEIVRHAVLNGCGVEIVSNSEELMRAGGVGCLLRYLAAEPSVSRKTA